ncbi:MFS transporter [Halonotius aquaticus]|uniref:Sec-independent protein translocase protein TatC n=1 Tax=Halonotius aquaticus TaxID=2216978 RepID=A0A3A6PPR5_9EURY|nr:twin-arginine translocase subunit TatC [Halonotius aquaticus]RJX43686.1 MFS transporter [Halonotius aquaticus]
MAESPDGSDDPPDREESPPADGEPSAPAADGNAADTADATAEGDEVETTDEAAAASTAEATPPANPAADGGTGNSVAADQPPATAGDATVEEGLTGEGPATDEEMPLADHIEEMMRRLGLVFLIGGIALAIAYPFAGDLVNYLWSVHIPEPVTNRPRLYGPLEFILTKLKVAGLAGLIVGLPMFVYQTYRFMRPGLYPTERRYYLAAVPTSLVLGTLGVLFAHFVVLPFVFAYFTTYTAEAAVIAFGLQETFNLILVLMGWMAIIFQIPLFIMLAIMMNLVTRQWLEAKRLIFWGSFLGIAFLFSPDPTGMAPIIVALTMVVLFEGTLALLRWTGN